MMGGIPRIVIEQQFGVIGVKNVRPQLHIERPQIQEGIQDIKADMPEMKIDSKLPSLTVDWRQVDYETGRKHPPDLTKDFSDKGKEGARRGTRMEVENGNILGDVTKPGDKVGKLAHDRTMARALKNSEFNIGLMPKSPPEFEWDKGQIRINWSKNSVVIDWDKDFMPKITIDPKYSVQVFLLKEPYIRIIVEEAEDSNRPGKLVNQVG